MSTFDSGETGMEVASVVAMKVMQILNGDFLKSQSDIMYTSEHLFPDLISLLYSGMVSQRKEDWLRGLDLRQQNSSCLMWQEQE